MRRSKHYFVIANRGVRVPVHGGVPLVPEDLPADQTLVEHKSAVPRTPEEENQYLQQQLHTRVRVERSLRQAKITADERRAEAEQVREDNAGRCPHLPMLLHRHTHGRAQEVCRYVAAPEPSSSMSHCVIFADDVDDISVCPSQAREYEEEQRVRAEAARNEAERQARYAKKRQEEVLLQKADVENLYRRARNALAESVGAQREAEHQAAHAIASLSAAEEMQMDAERYGGVGVGVV